MKIKITSRGISVLLVHILQHV